MRKDLITAGIIFVIIILAGFGLIYVSTQQRSSISSVPATVEQKIINQTSNNMQQTDEKVGTGAEAKNGNTVTVNYVGTLQNGKEFDSSYKRNQPFTFTLGKGDVIKGWDLGVVGMKVGGKRKLIIPPDLAYGNQSVGGIPANSTLTFEIELLSLK